MNKQDVQNRFDSKYIPEPNSGCWLWEAQVGTSGYGTLSVEGRGQGAHRVSYMLHTGNIPKGLSVLHTCDNPLCVNPNHLFLGTQYDNMKDMTDKGRRYTPGHKGESHPRTSLTDAAVRHIIQDEETSYKELALLFEVSYCVIAKIKTGATWKHLQRR